MDQLRRETVHDFSKEHVFCLAIDEQRQATIGISFNPVKHWLPYFMVSAVDADGLTHYRFSYFFKKAVRWYLSANLPEK